jgi:hypothetical protein
MEEVFAKFQLLRRIAGTYHATRCQRRSHLRTRTSSRISCQATINISTRTAPSLHRSVPSSGRTPRCTVSTRRTSFQSSSTRQRVEDYSPAIRRAGKRSTTGTAKGNLDRDSKTNTSQPLILIQAEQSSRVSDSPQESRNGTATALQKKNSLSHQLRRVIFYASATLRKQYFRHTSMTLTRTTRTTETLSTLNGGYMNHHDAEAYGDRGHTPWRKSYTNMTPKTRSNVIANAHHKITIMRSHHTRSPNAKSIWTTKAGEDTCTPIQEMRDSTHSGNLDSNSRKATGQRITTTSDQVNHLSETKPIQNGTRRLILDHTL